MLGFIVEGDTEKMILESSDFREFLREHSIDFIKEVINVKGNNNLLPHKIVEYTKILVDNGVTQIIILTDLDDDLCITETKNRIAPRENQIAVISVKQIEAWFLSDTNAIKQFLKTEDYTCENPELISDPFDEIRKLRIQYSGRGIQGKLTLAKLMIDKYSFSIVRAAKHPNCNSAKYFLEKLRGFAKVAS